VLDATLINIHTLLYERFFIKRPQRYAFLYSKQDVTPKNINIR